MYTIVEVFRNKIILTSSKAAARLLYTQYTNTKSDKFGNSSVKLLQHTPT